MSPPPTQHIHLYATTDLRPRHRPYGHRRAQKLPPRRYPHHGASDGPEPRLTLSLKLRTCLLNFGSNARPHARRPVSSWAPQFISRRRCGRRFPSAPGPHPPRFSVGSQQVLKRPPRADLCSTMLGFVLNVRDVALRAAIGASIWTRTPLVSGEGDRLTPSMGNRRRVDLSNHLDVAPRSNRWLCGSPLTASSTSRSVSRQM